MDADQRSVTSSVVDPFGLQRRPGNVGDFNTSYTKENRNNVEYNPRNNIRNVNSNAADISSSEISTSQKATAMVDENNGRMSSRQNDIFGDQQSQRLMWSSDKYTAYPNNDETRQNSQKTTSLSNDTYSYSTRLRPGSNFQQAQQRRSWTDDTTTLHTVTEDYGDDSDTNNNEEYHTNNVRYQSKISIHNRSVEENPDETLAYHVKQPMRSGTHFASSTHSNTNTANIPSRARIIDNNSSPSRVNTPRRTKNNKLHNTESEINQTDEKMHFSYRSSPSLDQNGASSSVKKAPLNSNFDYSKYKNNGLLTANRKSSTTSTIINNSPMRNNSHQLPPSQEKIERLEVSYGSPAHTAMSQLSSSPLEKISTGTIQNSFSKSQPQQPSQLQQQQSRFRSSYTQQQASTNATIRESSSRVHQPLTAKYISQLQSQLEECQKELAYVTKEKRESQERTELLESELQEVTFQHEAVTQKQHQDDVQRRTSVENKERQLTEWEKSLRKASDEIQHMRDELNRRKTSMNGLENTVIELETTHQQEQARLSTWQEELLMQQDDLEQERQQLIDQREATNQEQQIWNAEKSGLHEEILSQQRRLAGWEKRLFQNETKLQEQQRLLQQHEVALLSQREELDVDRAELHNSLKELDAETSRSEAKLQLMEQAMDELMMKRKEEEKILEEIVQRRKEHVAVSEREAHEWEKTKTSLDLDISSSRQQLQVLRKQIEGAAKDLTAATDRVQSMTLEEQKKREAQSKAETESDQRLSAILNQLQVAQREKEKLENYMKEKQTELEKVQSHMNQEEARWKRNQESLQNAKLELEQQKSETLRQTDTVINSAKQQLQALSNRLSTQHVDASQKLENRMNQVEALQNNLDKVARAYENKFRQLQKDDEYNQRLRQQLDDRLKASTNREEQIRQDSEWTLDRLQQRLDTEANKNKQQLIDIVTKMKQDHAEAMQGLTERLEVALSERDSYRREIDSLRLEIEQMDEELASIRESFGHDTSRLQRDLSLTRERAEIAENHLLAMQQEKSIDKKEIENMKRKMDWLESQTSIFEKTKKEWEKEHMRLKEVDSDFQNRMNKLNEQEQYLLDEDERIERKRRNLEYGFRQLDRQKQKAVLTRFFMKPLRCEREEVSAAFSKWVRTVMFKVNENNNAQYKGMVLQSIATVEKESDEAQQYRNQLIKERDNLLEKDRKMQRELNAQRAEYIEMSQDLQGKIEQLKQDLHEAQQNNKNGHLIKSFEANGTFTKAIVDRESELKRQEEEVLQMKRRFQQQEQLRAQEFETANERIRELAERLSQKDKEISRKQDQLESEKAEYLRKEQKLQSLVCELQDMNTITAHQTEIGTQTKNQLSPTRNKLLFDDNSSTPSRLSQIHDDSWLFSPANKIIR